MSDVLPPPPHDEDPALERTLAELSARFRAAGMDYDALSVDDKGALLPFTWDERERPGAPGTVEERTLPALGYELSRHEEKLVLGAVLGEGGEGVVRLALQPDLARTVAVKVLLPSKENRRRGAPLLREARITGALEHPNIVPVHDIGVDDKGVPMIVMKRIEGRAWSEEVRRNRPPTLEDEWLERQLRVLVQVARAVSFAHSRRVLHRDLKPANVMIGAFDEVYVVDWGVAAALPGCEIPGLPPASVAHNVVGTPSYMAPEMIVADGGPLSERTDVYLLGAMLHEVVTGLPPHFSPSLALMVAKAYRAARPSYDATVPQELVALLDRALSKAPEDRFPGAASFADAVEDFLRHRHSTALSTEGRRRFRSFVAALAEDSNERAMLWRECRSLFEQSLLLWKENPAALAGLAEAVERMVDHELQSGRPDAARAVLGSLPAPPPDLIARVDEAEASSKSRSLELERIARDSDMNVGLGGRSLGGVALGLLHVSVNLVCAVLDKQGVLAVGHFEYAAALAVLLGLALSVLYLLRKRVLKNEASRRVTVLAMVILGLYPPFFVLTGLLELRFVDALALKCFLKSAVWITTAYALDRTLFVVAAMGLVEIGLIVAFPGFALEMVALAGLVSMLGPPLFWQLRQERL